MTGKVEELLLSERKKSPLLFVLIDSEVSQIDSAVKLAKDVEQIGAASILVGGSSATDQMEMAEVVKNLKSAVNIPIILFPGNITGVVPQADAIFTVIVTLSVLKKELFVSRQNLREKVLLIGL